MKQNNNQSINKIPLPEEHYRNIGIGSRTTFWRWEKEGLKILKIGRRRFIYESDLSRFLEEMNEGNKNPTK
jgi:hypothetical protein